MQLSAGGGSWASLSDQNMKDNITAIDPRDILAAVVNMPISTWNYESQDESIQHIGPMVQDFYAAFGVGEDDLHITSVDADGVALAAIQGLHAENEALRERIEALEAGGFAAAQSNPLLVVALALAAGLAGSLIGAHLMQQFTQAQERQGAQPNKI
jgi:hypothetical protein